MDPMLKSVLEEVHEKAGEEIYRSCTKFREPWNFIQYLFPDYALMPNRGIEGIWSFAVVCMNDNGVENFDESKHDLIRVLDDIYPEKCGYEKESS